MNTVYTVSNGDGVLLAVYYDEREAKRIAKDVGKKLWKEKWYVTAIPVGVVEEWILRGNPEYAKKKRKSNKNAK